MTGGGGSDIYKLENIGVTDLITDFKGVSGANPHDTVDLTALLTNVNTALPVSDYVQYNQSTGALKVDPSGDNVPAHFIQVATLDNGASHPAAGTVNVVYHDNTAAHAAHAHVV
jgi:hypothetical protein